MPLENQKYEIAVKEFVRAYLNSDPTSKSRLKDSRRAGFARAGFTSDTNSAKHNARRFYNRPEVKERVKECISEFLEYANITPEKVAIRVNRIAACQVSDFYENDGRTLKPFEKLAPEQLEAIKSIEWVPVRHDDGTIDYWSAKLELHDKLQANLALLRYLEPPVPEQPAVNMGGVNIINVLSIEDQRILAQAITDSPETVPGGEAEDSGTDQRESGEGGAVPTDL
jgi:hypothetical protein